MNAQNKSITSATRWRALIAASMAISIAMSLFGTQPPPARAESLAQVTALPDFGDAPDSMNNHPGVVTNSAYPGVPGNFPTVWDGTPLFGAAGPKHAQPDIVYLGTAVTGETDADLAPDDDGTLNILNGGADNSDNDQGDDGWLNRGVRFHNCAIVPVKVRVSRSIAFPLGQPMYLNVWFDGNRDGDWNDEGNCPLIDLLDPLGPPALPTISPTPLVITRSEWIVQNQLVPIVTIPPNGHRDFTFYTKQVLNTTEGSPHWLRFTLSGRPAVEPSIVLSGSVPMPDGRGLNPPDAFLFGETEDYKQDLTNMPQPGTLTIVKSASAPASPRGGDAVNYRIDVEHVGGAADAATTIKDRLPDGVGFVGPISVVALTGTVSPLSASIVSNTVAWNGDLSPGAKVRIIVPVRLDPCVGANKVVTNVARALQTDGSVISDTNSLNVTCSPPPNVDVRKDMLRVNDAGDLVQTFENGMLPGDDIVFRFTAKNNGTETATIFVRDDMPPSIRSTTGDHTKARGKIEVAPGLTATLDIAAHVIDRCDIGRVITNVAEYTAVPGGARALSAFDLPPGLPRAQTNVLTMRMNCDDVGDAPDSTNHFGTAMVAYPALGNQANYPTVFDPTTGADQGPLHRNPHPFHLGERFSIEGDADTLPDQDLVRNIVPPANDPDNDRADDGVGIGQINFADCTTTMIPVKVFIGPNAAAFFAAHVGNGTGYLNVWVDGNRDGDWADVRPCPGIDGNRPAFEHIVIDHQVSLGALGSGLHTVNVPTRLVPWAAELKDRPAWLRVTLSEDPSSKPLTLNGFNHGDGRGFAAPFDTGETEDYLWRPDRVADVTIAKRGAMRTESGDPINGNASSSDNVVWQIKYANLGNADATSVVITDDLIDAGNKSTFNVTSVPSLPYTLSGNTLTFDIGTLAAGTEGTIMVELGRHIAHRVYTNTVAISATNDIDASNNSAQATARHAFLQPPLLLNPLDGTTCDGNFTGTNELLGLTTEFATVDLYVDGVLTATLQAGGSGYFRHDMVLPDGTHELYAVARVNGHEATGETRTVIVNSALSFDPLSIRFKLDGGGYYRPTDANGRTDESGWEIHLLANRTYTASVRLCCESPTAQVTLDVNGTPLILTDSDGDRVYEGTFTTSAVGPTVTSTLTVDCNGVTTESTSQVLIDPDGTVFDVATGATLNGATVMCLQQNASNLPNATFVPWSASTFGQINPQTTGSNGYFAFFTPPGTYRLDVNRAGYQSYVSPDLNVIATPVHHDVPLTPIVSEPAQVTIVVDENGFTPAIMHVPAGTVIAFVNGDVGNHTASGTRTTTVGTVASAIGGFDSGSMGPGQRYVVKLGVAGSYTFGDANNPNASGLIVVAGEQPPSGLRVMLPLLAR
jgi:plastocyanin